MNRIPGQSRRKSGRLIADMLTAASSAVGGRWTKFRSDGQRRAPPSCARLPAGSFSTSRCSGFAFTRSGEFAAHPTQHSGAMLIGVVALPTQPSPKSLEKALVMFVRAASSASAADAALHDSGEVPGTRVSFTGRSSCVSRRSSGRTKHLSVATSFAACTAIRTLWTRQFNNQIMSQPLLLRDAFRFKLPCSQVRN